MQKKKILIILAATVAFFSLGVEMARAATCTTTLPAGSDIQAAIDAANSGDVICLSPGVYSPAAQIDINKSITLQGPQFGIDPRPGAGTVRTPGDALTEAVIDGSTNGLSGIIVITADNVVLDGLDITGGSGDMIDSESGTPTANIEIRYTIIHDSVVNPGDEGMQIRNCTDCIIEYNYIVRIAQDAINVCCDSTGGLIQYNEIHDNSSENAAIYVYDAENTTIQCNLVYNTFENDGIKLGARGGGDASLTGGSILNNTVHNTAQDGIAVYMSNSLVEGNEIYSSTSQNGAIYVMHAVSNITITRNYVHNNSLTAGDAGGITIGTDSGLDVSTIIINNNNFENNSPSGLSNRATTSVNAQNNWWGSADGPAGEGPGSGDPVSANVDFTSWLAQAEIIDNPCSPDTPPPPSASIPTLGEWGMILMSLILAGSAFRMIRRRQVS